MYPKEIENREDVYHLVASFYDKLKVDDFIGHIFTTTISDEKWEPHLQKLTDFWESNLFRIAKFSGNPPKAHRDLDAAFNYSIDQKHFGKWLELWFATIDEFFIGERANMAKERARNIANMLFFKMYDAKPKS